MHRFYPGLSLFPKGADQLSSVGFFPSPVGLVGIFMIHLRGYHSGFFFLLLYPFLHNRVVESPRFYLPFSIRRFLSLEFFLRTLIFVV